MSTSTSSNGSLGLTRTTISVRPLVRMRGKLGSGWVDSFIKLCSRENVIVLEELLLAGDANESEFINQFVRTLN